MGTIRNTLMPTVSNKPTSSAWLIAIMSLILLLVTLGLIGTLSSELALQAAHRQLSVLLKDPKWSPDAAARSVSILVNRPYLSGSLERLIYPAPSSESEEVQELYESVELFRLGHIRPAVDKARILIANMEQRLQDLPSTYETVRLATFVSEARASLANYANQQRQLRNNELEQNKAAAELKRLSERMTLVANDLGELFSLTPRYRREGGPTEIELYQEGVLRELPQLIDLTDGINDLVTLRTELERAGGKVRSEADNHEVFMQKIEALRDLSHQITTRSNELQAGREDLDEESEGLKRVLEASGAEVGNRMQALLIVVSEPILKILPEIWRVRGKEKA